MRTVEETRRREAVAGALEAALAIGSAHARVGVVMVHGPAGIGKSTEVDSAIDGLRERGVRVARLPTQGIEASALALEQAVAAARLQFGSGEGARVLVVDPADALVPLLPWLVRRASDPDQRCEALVIVTRSLPSRVAQAEIGMRGGVRLVEIAPLSREDAHRLLASHGVPAERRDALAARMGGHPLSLTLAARAMLAPGRGTEVAATIGWAMREAVERLVAEVPDEEHHTTLIAAAANAVLDEPTLAAVCPGATPERRRAAFAWLARLPFVRDELEGIVVHDVVRPILLEDALARTSPLVGRVYRASLRALGERRDGRCRQDETRLVDRQTFLVMNHPMVRATFGIAELSHRLEPLVGPHRDAALDLVAAEEGGDSARAVAELLGRTGTFARAVLDEDATMRAFFVIVPYETARRAPIPEEATRAFVRMVGAHPDYRSAHFARAWGSVASYQRPGDPWVSVVNHEITRRNLATNTDLAVTCSLADPAYDGLLDEMASDVSGVVQVALPEGGRVLRLAHTRASRPGEASDLFRVLWQSPATASADGTAEEKGPANALSDRELEVVRGIAEGYRYDQIADRLGLSLGTVRTYVRRAYGKLGVTTKSEATLIAARMGWIR